MTGQTVSKIAFFPLASRRHLVRRSAVELDKLNGRAADTYWKKTCRALGQELLSLGCPEETMRAEVMEFQNAVQWELVWLHGSDAAEG
ncbi:DUF6074 family protein [Peteryoungia ipomoeae]|uniref:Uncharacterized protein n=1 Tax=Peteryoungia ipomoeae TaxID=1210932 RepID=A0A4S8P4E3_9HYPH|nr:DUF6074 family protein [Peteryoungia ipomoeae]THV24868.1 hypothetical protein FAA97_01250 [Peteryoungia ipomoeae]